MLIFWNFVEHTYHVSVVDGFNFVDIVMFDAFVESFVRTIKQFDNLQRTWFHYNALPARNVRKVQSRTVVILRRNRLNNDKVQIY